MAFSYLLLGHLIGDFALQSNKIAENKSRHWKWNLLHVLVVTSVISFISSTFGTLLLVLVFLNGMIHYVMDYYKNWICQKLHLSALAGFLLDQFFHVLLLYMISLTAVYEIEPLMDYKTVSLLLALVTATSFSAVWTQFVLGALFPKVDNQFFRDGEKHIGILTRIYAGVVFYMAFIRSPYYLLLLGILAMLIFLRFKQGWNKWMSPSHLVVKLLLDTVISLSCIFPIIFL